MKEDVQQRRSHVDKAHVLSIVKQSELLSIHRSGLYYKPVGETVLNLELMRLIDQQYMKYPFLGVPRMTAWLRKDKGYKINKKRVERLYRLMGISAIGPKPNTSKRGKGSGHRVYPYLLRSLDITHANQVWATDITYVPIQSGYLYLCAIIDVYSRYVLGWSLSNTMTSAWCKDVLQEAVSQHGKPQILNTDQGSQFTANEFSSWVSEQDIRLSMDGKGRAIDNIFIERLWRSVKYEQIYLYPAGDGLECYNGLARYFTYYNCERRHQSLQDECPVYLYKQRNKQVA